MREKDLKHVAMTSAVIGARDVPPAVAEERPIRS
jgi:hypothetical protein